MESECGHPDPQQHRLRQNGFGIGATVGSTKLLLANNLSMFHSSGAFSVPDGDADTFRDIDPTSRNNLSGGAGT